MQRLRGIIPVPVIHAVSPHKKASQWSSDLSFSSWCAHESFLHGCCQPGKQSIPSPRSACFSFHPDLPNAGHAASVCRHLAQRPDRSIASLKRTSVFSQPLQNENRELSMHTASVSYREHQFSELSLTISAAAPFEQGCNG